MNQIPDSPGPAGPELPPSDASSSIPFEDASQPFLSRLLETMKLAFADPTRLFSNMPSENIGAPVLYGLITGTIAAVFTILWQTMFGGLLSIVESTELDDFAISTGFMFVWLIFSPVFIVVGLFVQSAIYHVMLLIVGDGQRGFGVTLRAVCYGSTPQLLGLVPLCGSLVGGIWSVVLVILAAIHGHRTDAWRVVLAYFLPTIVCCCMAFWLASMFGLLGALSR
jgi:hypothetical protein